MNDALVERLRGNTVGAVQWVNQAPSFCREAADRIEAHAARIAELEAVLNDELLDRVERALERHVYGHAARRIPADMSDSDIVLYEVRKARAALAPKESSNG